MSPDSEPLRRVPAPADELDAEREVDFGGYARTIVGKWWLLVIGAVVGGVLGFLYGQTGGSSFQAEATIYLGQPLSPSGSAPVPSLSSDPTGAATLARSQAVIRDVSAEVGIPAGKLRRNTSASVLGERNRQTTNVALIGIRVRGSDDEKVEDASNLIAERVVALSSTYADAKEEALQTRLEGLQTRLDSVTSRLDEVTASLGGTRRGAPPSSSSRRTCSACSSSSGPTCRTTSSTPSSSSRPSRRSSGHGSCRPRPPARSTPATPGRRRSSARSSASSSRRWRPCSGPPSRGVARPRVLDAKTVAVVVPAWNEERLIASTVAGVPAFVDLIFVVDDGSSDATGERAAAADPRVEVIRHERNAGVGAAIVTGYKRARGERVDVTAVMAADGQMDPDDLEELVRAVAAGETDYAKANRLFTGQAWQLIPKTRYLGNAVLSFLTKIASGYWHVADSQSGYTAVSLETLELIDLDNLYPRYGFPNDLLVHLNVWNRRVRDYPSRPIYGVGERSGIRLWKVVPTISWLLLKGFFWRMKEKYVIRDFHPLVLFYMLGILMVMIGLGLGIAEVVLRVMGNPIPVATIVLVALLTISGSQLLLFAMWFDMETNKDLR